MAEQFSMSAAAGFAYRKRESGRLLLAASGAYVGGMLLLLSVWAAANRDAFAAYIELVSATAASGRSDPQRTADVAGRLGASYLVLIPAVGVLFSAFEATCQRWLVRGLSDRRVLGLHFGADTWRLCANFSLWILFSLVGAVGVVAISGLAAALGGGERNPVMTGLLGLVGLLGSLGAWAYVAVRLAPAAAVTIGREKLSFFDAWRATRGRFWSLFGAFAFLFIIYLIALLIAEIVAGTLFLGPALQGLGASVTAESLFRSGVIFRFAAFYAVVLSVAQVFVIGMMGVNAFAALVAHDEGKV